MGQLSYEEFLRIFEHDDAYPIDETSFHFESEPREEHFLGCLREYEKPYWAGYCDIPDGAEFFTAAELLEAPIYGGRSIKDRWREVVLDNIGGISAESWTEYYLSKHN